MTRPGPGSAPSCWSRRQDRAPAGRRWAVPAAAAASVVLVAGLTAWATGLGGSTTGVGPRRPASVAPRRRLRPRRPGPDTVDVAASDTPTSEPATATRSRPDPGICARSSIEHVLKGAEHAAAFPADRRRDDVVLGQGRSVRALQRAARPDDRPPAAAPRARPGRPGDVPGEQRDRADRHATRSGPSGWPAGSFPRALSPSTSTTRSPTDTPSARRRSPTTRAAPGGGWPTRTTRATATR